MTKVASRNGILTTSRKEAESRGKRIVAKQKRRNCVPKRQPFASDNIYLCVNACECVPSSYGWRDGCSNIVTESMFCHLDGLTKELRRRAGGVKSCSGSL